MGCEASLGVQPGSAGFDKPQSGAGGKLLAELQPIRPAIPFDMLPVIHARPLQLGVAEFEPKRLDQMKAAIGGGAQARHVSRVGRDFRLNKNDMHPVYDN